MSMATISEVTEFPSEGTSCKIMTVLEAAWICSICNQKIIFKFSKTASKIIGFSFEKDYYEKLMP